MPAAGWSFFYLMNQTVPYLSGMANERLNYEAGDDVTLPVDPSKRYTTYTRKGPRVEDLRHARRARQRRLDDPRRSPDRPVARDRVRRRRGPQDDGLQRERPSLRDA